MFKIISSSNLTAKEKKYEQQVEKVLATFGSLEEWADYIAFLSKLQKAIQLNLKLKEGSGNNFFVPAAGEVAYYLSLCLSSDLPNGVHQKALNIYELVFQNFSKSRLNSELSIWLPGLLPLFSYSSISIKPLQISIFKNLVIPKLTKEKLQVFTKPLILCLLAGLDDENSEIFDDTMNLLYLYKETLSDDSHFWHCMFLCIMTCPERRIGALKWCERYLPEFANAKDTEGKPLLSEEAQLCLIPEAGLLVRAFASSIELSASSDIVAIRGFFDLLLSRIPLDSAIFDSKVSRKDKEFLIMACCRLTMRKDMSLNRRVWNYFLGPEVDGENRATCRRNYFRNHVLSLLSKGLLKLAHSTSIRETIDALKMSVYLIMDRWEINYELTPLLFSTFLKTLFEYKDNEELNHSALKFFEETKEFYMWKEVNELVVRGEETDFKFLDFILRCFDIHEEESLTIHAPYAAACLLSKPQMSLKKLEVTESILNLIPSAVFTNADEISESQSHFSSEDLRQSTRNWYETLLDDADASAPYSQEELGAYIIERLEGLYMENITHLSHGTKLIDFLASILSSLASPKLKKRVADSTFDLLLSSSPSPSSSPNIQMDEKHKFVISSSISKLLENQFSKFMTTYQFEKFLKITLSSLWFSITSPNPADHQVESVKHLFGLIQSFSPSKVEAGLLDLFNTSPLPVKIVAFETIWLHTSNDADFLLQRQLQTLFDSADEETNKEAVNNLIRRLCGSHGTSKRFFKLLVNPAFEQDFMRISRKSIVKTDDLLRFLYCLQNIHKCLSFNTKVMREHISIDIADSSENKMTVIKANEWDVLSYKILLVTAIDHFLSLEVIDVSVYEESKIWKQKHAYSECLCMCLEIYSKLINGNEKNFPSLFHRLLSNAFTYLREKDKCEIESVMSKFLDCILHFLSCATVLRIDLKLLHVEEQDKGPVLINFLLEGIKDCRSSILLEKWMHLLMKLTHIFGESIFSVILLINDAIISKISKLFERLLAWEEFDVKDNFEHSMVSLFNGLENLLTISHGYLLHSRAKNQAEKPTNGSLDSVFFNNVIQSVFQIESPFTKSSEENKLYSMFIALHDAVKVTFKIWSWADFKSQVPDFVENYSTRSLTYVSYKLKYRTKKILDTFFELEKQEVISSLIASKGSLLSTLKLLNILDNGRSQITLPFLLNFLVSRCNSHLVPTDSGTYIDSDVNVEEVSAFLVAFFDLMDVDTVLDVWSQTLAFLEGVLTDFSRYRVIVPNLLRICKVLAVKTNGVRSGRELKNRKSLSDAFTRLLTQLVSEDTSFKEKEKEKDKDKATAAGDSLNSSDLTREKIVNIVCEVTPHLNEIIQDSDKTSVTISYIQNNALFVPGRSKRVSNLLSNSLDIVETIGKHYPIRCWKNMVSDLFNDNDFFKYSSVASEKWFSIINLWIENDKDKFGDKVSRLSYFSTNPAGTLFSWNEVAEIENKVEILKRITYMILVQPVDYFVNNLSLLFEVLKTLLQESSCPTAIRIEITTLLRAIALKSNEMHLLSHWSLINHELLSIFGIAKKSTKEISALNQDLSKLILFACKLLDELLILKPDEFNLSSWLFVKSCGFEKKDQTPSIIDTISQNVDFTFSKVDAFRLINGTVSDKKLRPLLEGINKIESIAQLRSFFESLSMIHYERTYSLMPVDYNACIADVFNDLLV
ncbi:hypothetical protein KGF56_003043 [Candida oxycetoniae]|uniref:Dopey N-terminal domain-containing protein n=1 Tax=Candida oxycetoniae TaxID=497107 RepID=A0AAI9SW14_9ASCO|nr:uncharacterized protein KGF56_003043 [Candida oxycetoniae]KAI3404143.2 hypothetical protein KGF56_003043 [Candida oxycetoniae]